MTTPTMDGQAIRQWLEVLDAVSYYELFRLTPTATFDELRVAFHAFCEVFHPDVHRWRPPHEQVGIGVIYRRGAEAFRILSEPMLRLRYDEALAQGHVRPERLLFEMDAPRPSMAPPGPQRLVDKLRNAGARPFVLRAEELFKKGDPKQAKIQLVMAMHMDAQNPALEEFGRELDQAIKAKAEEEKKNWKRG